MAKEMGGFTLPGEAGYEKLTLELAKKWGADVIRDSDGTELSPEILEAGYGIYSTICIIRDHNTWAKAHPETQQQTFLPSKSVLAAGQEVRIPLLEGYFQEQFSINESEASVKNWQVFDRTVNEEVPAELWSYREGVVTVRNTAAWHQYSVNFMAYRIWEEISMYNHVTNSWTKEHLMQLDPRHPEVREYLSAWMEEWCKAHPATTVVRFTSLFYNFVWIWGGDDRNKNIFTDWGSYDFTVSPQALDAFEEAYSYRLTSEDFVNQGKFHVTHMPADKRKRDWMMFIHRFVADFGKELVDITHAYDKKAYVFYDDSWVGLEPYGPYFKEIGFDGLIKCIFSGFEVRLCAGAEDVDIHEVRLHPYLFPVGLGGLPTFMEGGNPTLDAKKYWLNARRAMLRVPIDRIGLGGYLHLTKPYPDFQDYIEKIGDEFRLLQKFHRQGNPYVLPLKVGVLTAWGKLRSWTLSGHFHETYMHDLIHILEGLSGLPLDVEFLDFEEAAAGVPGDVQVIINAGYAGSAWSGGENWADDRVVTALTEWVHHGGVYLGVGEPSALKGYQTYFRMAHVLGIDRDLGDRVCHGRWTYEKTEVEGISLPDGALKRLEGLYLTDGNASVLSETERVPVFTMNAFGAGKSLYLSSFTFTPANARWLMDLLLYGAGLDAKAYLPDNPHVECAYYPESKALVVINNSDSLQKYRIPTEKSAVQGEIEPYDTLVLNLE